MTKSVRRLAEQFMPEHYDLHINLSKRVERVFSGTVTLTGKLTHTAPHIALHTKELTITSASINGKDATTTQAADDELRITTGHDLPAADYTLHITFEGRITDPMHGLYPCYFTDNGVAKELLMTQLESHSAREVFPCVDEPAAKATFELTLTTEPGVTTLSNTPIARTAIENDLLVTTFEQTPKMSSYLLAFITGELVFKETKSQSGVVIRAYATSAHAEELGFSLAFAAKVLDFYDDYFGVAYPLPKCDLVACPDFAAGAMENWGLITFRESALLVNEKDASADTYQHVALVVAHELAHQWFGNLVTMAWWDHLWLNESFAKWMEYYSTAHFYPEWQLWEQYNATELQYALSRDGLASVQAVQQPVNHPDEIATLFDPAIVYAKGGSLIRMLNEYLGSDVFREGLRLYIKRHAYGNTSTQDLWRALSEASGKDIETFMDDWVSKPGHPVVEYTLRDNHATVSQRRFFSNPAQAKNDSTLWPVPLLSNTPSDTELLTEPSSTLVTAPADYHLLNEGGTGFYHVQYDAASLNKLAKAVAQQKLNTTDRQRLLMDSLSLNRAGVETTVDTLHLLNHYRHESNYAVWLAIGSATGALRLLVNDDPELKPDLQRFIANLSRHQFDRVGWEKQAGEDHFDTLLRPSLLANMVYAEDPAVIDRCNELFDAAQKPEDLNPDTRTVVYCAAVRKQGKPAVKKLLAWYKSTQSADERVNICAGITCIRDENYAQELLALLTTKTIKLQDIFYWFIYFIRSRYTRKVTWQWMQANWNWILDKFGGDKDYNFFAKYSASAFSTRDELALYRAFFEPKIAEPALARTVTQGFEDIETRILWRERDLESVAAYLKKV